MTEVLNIDGITEFDDDDVKEAAHLAATADRRYAEAEYRAVARRVRQLFPTAATLVVDKDLGDGDDELNTRIRMLILRDAADEVLWFSEQDVEGHDGMPERSPVKLHRKVWTALQGRLESGYDAVGGARGPLDVTHEDDWPECDYNLLVLDIEKALAERPKIERSTYAAPGTGETLPEPVFTFGDGAEDAMVRALDGIEFVEVAARAADGGVHTFGVVLTTVTGGGITGWQADDNSEPTTEKLSFSWVEITRVNIP